MSDQLANEITALSWGVKQSFRGYVTAAGGSTETGGGSVIDAEGAFTFEPIAGGGLRLSPDGRLEGVGRFAGEVRFDAHGGMLKVFIADPSIEVGTDGASLFVADTPARDRRVELARLDLAAATLAAGELVIPASLSRDGWQVLGDHYAAGVPIDPVRLKVGA